MPTVIPALPPVYSILGTSSEAQYYAKLQTRCKTRASLVVQISKKSTCNAGDLGSIPRSGRSPGEGNGYPLQYSYQENSMDRGTWWATVHGVAKSRIGLSD